MRIDLAASWLSVVAMIACAAPVRPTRTRDVAWTREPIATTSGLLCVGVWRQDHVWAETRAACGQAFERIDGRWAARPDVYNCYQRIPDECRNHGAWTSRDGALFWIHGAQDPPDTFVLEFPVHGLRQTMPFTAGDVWGRSATDVFAVGDRGAILHFDGTTWTREPADSDADLRAVRGADGEVLAVGTGGTVLRRGADGRWAREPAPTTDTLRDVEPTPEGWFAAGDAGVVLRRR